MASPSSINAKLILSVLYKLWPPPYHSSTDFSRITRKCVLRDPLLPFLNSCKLIHQLWPHRIRSITFWRSVYLPVTTWCLGLLCMESNTPGRNSVHIQYLYVHVPVYACGKSIDHSSQYGSQGSQRLTNDGQSTIKFLWPPTVMMCIHLLFTTDLIAFEVGPSAGGETLFTAEALELRAHTQRVTFDTFLLAPNTHNLHILYIFHCGGGESEERRQIITVSY